MHLPDGLLNGSVCATTALVSAGAIGYSLYRVRHSLGDRLAPLLGVMSAGVFAAQMVNYPLLVLPVSGHLMGGVLAAVMLGPWAGAVAVSVVLVVQCLLFADGGPLALGANVFNLAVLGSLVSYPVYVQIRRGWAGPTGIIFGAVLAAWVSVLLATGACALELSLSGAFTLESALPPLLFAHVLIGLGEATITGCVVAFVVHARPDLIDAHRPQESLPLKLGTMLAAGLSLALAIAVFVAPLASSFDDGLEWSLTKAGVASEAQPPVATALLPDYEIPGGSGLWFATSLAGTIGTLLVLCVAWSLAQGARWRLAREFPPPPETSPAIRP